MYKKNNLIVIAFSVSYGILLLSRLMVLTQNANYPIPWILIEVVYLGVLTMFWAFYANGIVIPRNGCESNAVMIEGLVLLHTVLFGALLTNQSFKSIIFDNFKSQLIYMLLVIWTAHFIGRFQLFTVFLKMSFYTISLFMTVQLLLNISDFDLTNVVNTFDSELRIRGVFGCGHPNIVGNVSVCNIILWILIRKTAETKSRMIRMMRALFAFVTFLMIVCAASRSSLTGLFIYAMICAYINIKNWPINEKYVIFLRWLIITMMLSILLSAILIVSLDKLLKGANRSLIFDVTIPTFLKSGRSWIGLGYASNYSYGNNMTPYLTYFIDNGYIYTLVSTGYIGAGMFIQMFYLIAKCFWISHHKVRTELMGLFVVYLYLALFEATLFTSGFLSNYIYIVIFLYIIGYEMKGRNIHLQNPYNIRYRVQRMYREGKF